MKNLVVLISGRGSNLRSIAEACSAERWPARIAAVISHRPDALGLAYARERGIAAQVIDHRAHPAREAFDDALAAALDRHAPDHIVLAGFMRILGDAFVQRFAGRMINIHPSLLPAFTGLHTHRRALEAGCTVAGATVHFVTPALDHGPIVAQAVVPVVAGDTEQTLAARVLEAEHVLYPRALRWWIEDRLAVDGLRVTQLDGEPQLIVRKDSPRC
ncbi:MAG: phosphoribosylglycinamide formyltransferase [Proteobacteria bacterium]|nr:phosphoribosylglycinamide formyltransferase [Pseudomonadota bacterium]